MFLARGDLVAAEAEEREAIAANDAWGIELGRSYPAAYLANALLERNDPDGAEDAIARAGFGELIPDNAHALYLFAARSRLRAHRGELEQAFEDMLESGSRYERTEPRLFPWRSNATLVALRLGRRDEARELAAAELELARSWGAPRPLARALRAAGLVHGGDAGLELLREAAATIHGSGARPEEAKALVELRAALRRSNRRIDARDELRRGVELALGCGATALAKHGNNELAATGARQRKLLVSGVDALTASERRVAEAATTGMTNKEIAQALFITVKTVELHLSSVYRKLDIAARTELARVLAAAREPATAAS